MAIHHCVYLNGATENARLDMQDMENDGPSRKDGKYILLLEFWVANS